MGKFNDEMDKLNDKKVGKKPNPIRKCMYVNCPIAASTEVMGQYRCSFHETGYFHGEVTMAIRANVNFIKAYSAMVEWSVPDWKDQKVWLQENKNCPMAEGEVPSQYLTRFFSFLSDKIKAEASEHIERKTNGVN